MKNFLNCFIESLSKENNPLAKQFINMLKGNTPTLTICNSGNLAIAEFYTKDVVRDVRLTPGLLSNKCNVFANDVAKKYGLTSMEILNIDGKKTVSANFNWNVGKLDAVPAGKIAKLPNGNYHACGLNMNESRRLFSAIRGI